MVCIYAYDTVVQWQSQDDKNNILDTSVISSFHGIMKCMEMETTQGAVCGPHDHASVIVTATDQKALARAAEIFRAAGDLPRLQLLDLLRGGELCVAEMAAATGTKLSTLSQQLRILRTEDLIVSRRQGKHIFYSLADRHIAALLENAFAHAGGDCGSSC